MSDNTETRSRGPAPGSGAARQSVARARAAYGDSLPDWVEALAQSCDASSQSQVAKRLRFSPSVVNQVVNGTYKGSNSAIEQAVRGVLLAESLACPVLGDLPRNICIDHQKRARGNFTPTSSARVQLYRACKGGCPFSRVAREFNHGE